MLLQSLGCCALIHGISFILPALSLKHADKHELCDGIEFKSSDNINASYPTLGLFLFLGMLGLREDSFHHLIAQPDCLGEPWSEVLLDRLEAITV